MKQYKLVNNLVGWFAFVIAAFTYCMTIEPTASFWDCPEFITTGYKLEVGHPPGAPFFMLTANLFSQFTSDPSQVARMVNTMSALMSAACILFLFWSITHLVKKLICPDDKEMTLGKLITIMGSGLVGALAYTWSDTFWFSAVEGEVYAYSSLFTAVVFWLILKWESVANEPHSDRWLVLIAYLTGLSFGVGCSSAVRYRAGRSKSGRMVRTAVRQQFRYAFQQRSDCIYHSTRRIHYLGCLRKLYGKEPQTHEYLLHGNYRHAGHPLLWLRMEQRLDRHYHTRNLGRLSVC